MRNQFDTLENRRLLATYSVTSFLDSGAGSLRWAIDQANTSVAHDTIQFNIAGSGANISLQSSLTINQPVTIDATTQPGYSGVPVIRLNDGNGSGHGFYVNAPDTTIRGLSITGFGGPASSADGQGIILVKSNARIEKCYIGLRPDGGATPNESDGIYVGSDADNTVIRDCVISGNGGHGINVSPNADYVDIFGNTIGLDPTGTIARPNTLHGVRNGGAIGLEVGGYTTADRNIISANGQSGVYFANLFAKGTVRNNHIGTSKAGNVMIANGDYGVWLQGTEDILIGSTSYPNRFGGDGVMIAGNGQDNSVFGNIFGIGASPVFDIGYSIGVNVDAGNNNDISYNTLGRLDTGIRVTGSGNSVRYNYVGVTEGGTAVPNVLGITTQGSNSEILNNVVANNTNFGIWVVNGSGHALQSSTYNNGQSIWVSTGANVDLQPPKILTVTEQADGKYDVYLEMYAPAESYRLDFYESDAAGHADSGDTQRLTQSVNLNADGSVMYRTFTINNLADGRFVTATLTLDPWGSGSSSTSEPSIAKAVIGSPAVYASAFQFETGHAWTFQFSQNVGASLNASDVTIFNTDTFQTYSPTSVTWDVGSKTAKFTRSTPLPDGQYTARIEPYSVSGPGGTNRTSWYRPFFVLAGDANRDQKVDFDDLLIVAQNYGKQTKTFSQGNFNYDAQGKVDFDDLLMLAQRYGTNLFSTSPIAATRKSSKVSSDVLS